MTTTFIYTHPDCTEHDTGRGHPERPERIAALLEAMEALAGSDGDAHVEIVEGRHATEEEVALAHPPDHIDRIRTAVRQATEGGGLLALDPDTIVSPGSWNAALAAAGCALQAVDAVNVGDAPDNAFCAVRPPGHHATATQAMGFCLFNNVAVAARYARTKGMRRTLIIDWDVHHGNGTEAIFSEDPDVFYLSMHQFPHYPGTGRADDRGRGPGEGTTLNLPVGPGQPPETYVEELLSGLGRALAEFDPDLILVSAGFDAAAGDPLAGLTLRPEDYHTLTRSIVEAAGERCDGRLVSVLEGGYQLENLRACAAAHVRGLAGLELG